MTRFAVDATAVSPRGKGISRVMRGATEALARHGVDLVALAPPDVALHAPRESVRARPAVLWEQFGLARAGRRFDAVLTPTERLPVASGGRFVVWLYETPTRRLAAASGVYQRGSDLVTRLLWKRSLRRAARVLAGSEATAAELRAALPDLGDVVVVHPGVDARFVPGPGSGGHYVFHLASDDPRDNTGSVVKAVELANQRLRDPVQLLVAGNAPRFETVGHITDEELLDLYRGAAAYLDASLFEGFGYQPLEAMACGTPVVASTASGEVVGEAGFLCDPLDVQAQADAIVRLLEEPGLADDLRRRGLERAREFSWERTAAQLAEILDEVAS